MWIPAVTVLGFLGVSVPSCPLPSGYPSSNSPSGVECPHPPLNQPEIWLLRSPFRISLAPRARTEERISPNQESMTIIFPAGAGMDREGGGYHARVGARVAASILTTHSPGFLSPGCAAQVCGSTVIIHLRYPSWLRRRMLETLAALIQGSIREETITIALHQEKQRDRHLLCPCLNDSPCPVIQQAIFQGIEVFDPLPDGATRRGNRLFLHRVSEGSCRRWIKRWWKGAWVHLDLNLTEIHQKNRLLILADLESGLGQLPPTGSVNRRPLISPIFFPVLPHSSPIKPGEAWTLLELSARLPTSGNPNSRFGEERISLHRQTFPAGTEIEAALMQRAAERLISHEQGHRRFCHSSPAHLPSVFDRYSTLLQPSLNWQEPQVSRRLFLYLREGIVFCSWQ